MLENVLKEYKDNIEKYTEEKKRQEKLSSLFGYVKLLLVVFIVLLIVFGIVREFTLWLILSIATIFIAEVFFWAKHSYVIEQVKYFQGLIDILNMNIARIEGRWSEFPDSGEEFVDRNHNYTYDFDIFGKGSIFQFLNVSKTLFGRNEFKKDLSESKYSIVEIGNRQEAIRELSTHSGLSNDYQYYGDKIENKDDISEFISKELSGIGSFITNKMLNFIVRFLPLVTVLFVCMSIGFKLKWMYVSMFSLIAFQTILWVVCFIRTNGYLSIVDNVKNGFKNFAKLFELIERDSFESELLKRIHSNISSSDISASKGIYELDKILQRISVKANPVIYFLANAILLWDINSAVKFNNWKDKYEQHIVDWFESLAVFESLLSFANIYNCVENLCIPKFVEEKGIIQTQSVGHPLILNDKRVYNSFEMRNDIIIVSGSNMSGKTTFLRTIGVNIILAKCGCAVCAENFNVSDMQIISSMRISDNLNDGISTFYAELKKIRAIIDFAENNSNVVFFIDEIFKGTNSVDRINGARKVIEKLYNLKASGFLTTHDLSLCEAEKENQIKNWHFSEQYINDELKFDYKIKPGIAETTNGEYLMRMLGILD